LPSSNADVNAGEIIEAIGITYKDSFAGLLNHAGAARTPKVEFLNAGVASYSPSI
jgi:hypothetical protein